MVLDDRAGLLLVLTTIMGVYVLGLVACWLDQWFRDRDRNSRLKP